MLHRSRQRARRPRAAECRHIDGKRTGAKSNGGQGSHCRSTGSPEYVRLGKRISQQHLHQDTGDGEQTAYSECGQRPGKSQFVHETLDLVRCIATQRLHRFGKADVGAASRDREQKRGDDDQHQCEKQHSMSSRWQGHSPGA